MPPFDLIFRLWKCGLTVELHSAPAVAMSTDLEGKKQARFSVPDAIKEHVYVNG